MGVLEGDVEIGQHQTFGHQGHEVAHMRIGVDIVQPHPGAERAQIAGEVGDMGAVALVGGVAQVKAVGRGVLADDEEFPDPGGDEFFGLAQDGMGGAADERAAHRGDDAEAAGVIAAFGNLEIAVVPRRELDARRGQEVDEGVGRGRHGAMDGVEHLFVLLRTGDGEHAGMGAGDVGGIGAEAAGDDDAAVVAQRFADGLEAFGLGAVEKAAGVDDHGIGAGVIGRDRIALGAQAGEDAFAVDERLGAAERDHADGGLAGAGRRGDAGAGREVGAEVGRVLHAAPIAGAGGGGQGVVRAARAGSALDRWPHSGRSRDSTREGDASDDHEGSDSGRGVWRA